MSEIQKDKEFFKKAATVAAGIGVVGAAATWAVGSQIQNEKPNEYAKEVVAEQQADEAAEQDLIKTAVNNYYDNAIGKIEVTTDSSLIAPAEKIVENSVGEQYAEIETRIYEPLLASAQQHQPQPGDELYVVPVDIDPEKQNGTEYVVVDSEHVVHKDLGALPAPTLESNK